MVKIMCLFPIPNGNIDSIAYKKGVTTFECGACPECLAKRSRVWALRSCYEAKESPTCMITLTYDSFLRDKFGNVIGEKPVDTSKHVNKRDCQLFIKRLRKHFSDDKIKYIITAEYGKRTHRAHYHALIFGLTFNDLIFYKRSKRGNLIYKSKTLEKIWSHGICTVDAVNVSAKIARYCTKYCAKDSRADDTFMLFSRGIGEIGLLRDFNGKSYWVDGREYPIPRQIWEKIVVKFFNNLHNPFNERGLHFYFLTSKYISKNNDDFYLNVKMRERYRAFRDSLEIYQNYLKYWSKKVETFEISRPDVFTRILQLPNDKYFSYKQKALEVITERKRLNIPYTAPRSGCVSQYERWKSIHLPFFPCHERANDTNIRENLIFLRPIPPEPTPFDDMFDVNSG